MGKGISRKANQVQKDKKNLSVDVRVRAGDIASAFRKVSKKKKSKYVGRQFARRMKRRKEMKRRRKYKKTAVRR